MRLAKVRLVVMEGGWGRAAGGPSLLPLLLMLLLLLCLLQQALSIPGAAVQDPACGSLGPGECMARASKCKLVKKLGSGTGGPVKGVFDCAKALGVPKKQVISVLAPAFADGKSETIVDRIITNDTATARQLRSCVLTTSGLLTLNGTIARPSMVKKLLTKGVFTHPAIIDIVAAAITSCPEPPNLKMTNFLECLRATCIQTMPPGVSALPTFGLEDKSKGTDDDDD